ncbi:MAG: hypothetical protein OXN17_10280 [Candidatus Poribacteria bacterium]|nr:hypothetical protein [Candidatus Poribacteria bacterium]MDE0502533.1 hypothetical protein [Candidatus Poribacteria bacterium]
MLENFQLVAIVKHSSHTQLRRIPLHQELQDNLATDWHIQYDTFLDGINEIRFDPGYTPAKQEIFFLNGFELPVWLENQNSLTVTNLGSIGKDDTVFDSVKGIVAFARNQNGQELVLFQRFTRTQVIQPGRFLFMQSDTYTGVDRPALMLNRKLSAIYQSDERKLLFDSYRNVNTFLPLDDFYKEASEQDIREILNHERLAPENPEEVATNPDQWTRKRFALLKHSGILDTFSTDEILTRSEGYDIEIQIVKERVVFPSDRRRVKKLLQFLNEELFRGAITNTLYETNSKKKAE